ncbi:lariat debranching enzyme [Blastocladiella emersonii ATCC 22665]|nr:lariat debranching enzyme [Blastocladiella emersonii ATCC 22665]
MSTSNFPLVPAQMTLTGRRSSLPDSAKMRVAVIGCGHGLLDSIYDTVRASEVETKIPVDLVIICGDFQAVRNEADLSNLSVPKKYQKMADFHQYYSRQKEAPYLTIFIGGNHESSAFMWELYHGGWVAPNIYFLGLAGVVNVGTLRIAGMSGIWKPHDYVKPHFEVAPYNDNDLRTIYHVRMHEVMQMTLYNKPIDIFLSHDWPRNIAAYGDVQRLKREKPFFVEDINTSKLGSPPMEHLLHHHRPSYWFSGHLHVAFAALVPHPETPRPSSQSQDPPGDVSWFRHTPKIESFDRSVVDPHTTDPARSTRFLALDKCMQRRHFIHFVDLPGHQTGPLRHDLDWLAVVKATHPLPLGPVPRVRERNPPPRAEYNWPDLYACVAAARAELDAKFHGPHDQALVIDPAAFVPTGPLHVGDGRLGPMFDLAARPQWNPQTQAFADLIGVENVINTNGVRWNDYVGLAQGMGVAGSADGAAPVPVDDEAAREAPVDEPAQEEPAPVVADEGEMDLDLGMDDDDEHDAIAGGEDDDDE